MKSDKISGAGRAGTSSLRTQTAGDEEEDKDTARRWRVMRWRWGGTGRWGGGLEERRWGGNVQVDEGEKEWAQQEDGGGEVEAGKG